MKKYLVSTIIVFVVLAFAWTVFGQSQAEQSRPRERGDWRMFQMLSPEEAAQMREKWPNMSEEEREKLRAKMREKWENMSDEEREKLRTQMRERAGGRVGERTGERARGLDPEEQLKAVKAIEEQLAKLKAGIGAMGTGQQRPFSELSDEERAKMRESFSKARELRQTALNEILKQLSLLQGRGPQAAEGEELVIVNTAELQAIHDLALKEKAEQTAQRIGRLSTGRRGFGGRTRGQMGPAATPGAPGGPRGPRATRGPMAPTDEGENKQEVQK